MQPRLHTIYVAPLIVPSSTLSNSIKFSVVNLIGVYKWMVWCMMFNATFSNISAILWQSVLLVVGFTSTYAGYWDQFLVLDLIPSWITLKIIKIVFLLVLR